MSGSSEILIEIQQVGNAVKVAAIDPETLIEVSIFGPPSAGEEALKLAAVRKLAYVLEKNRRSR
ncbi:MAG: DUF6898 family protein [Alphaproteobacteria bacterium]